MSIKVEPQERFNKHYYYDEMTDSWFYVEVRRSFISGNFVWHLRYVRHTLEGWEISSSFPLVNSLPLVANRFANYPFIPTTEDLK